MANQIIADQAHAQVFSDWIMQRCPGAPDPDVNRTRFLAYVDVPEDRPATPDDILTVCALHAWTTHGCEATLASNGAKRSKASHEFIFAIFDFVFNHSKRRRLVTHVSVDNHKSIAVQRMLGMKEEARLRDHFGEDKDALLFGMTKRDWLQGHFAKPSSPPTVNISN